MNFHLLLYQYSNNPHSNKAINKGRRVTCIGLKKQHTTHLRALFSPNKISLFFFYHHHLKYFDQTIFIPSRRNRNLILSMVGPNSIRTSKPTTIKFLCSYGGKILPRYPDGKLRYLGGETRVVAVDRSIPFSG